MSNPLLPHEIVKVRSYVISVSACLHPSNEEKPDQLSHFFSNKSESPKA